MEPLSNAWTWILKLYIPAAIAAILYVRGAFGAELEEVYISRSYWMLLSTLVGIIAATLVLSAYAKAARAKNKSLWIPANTIFEKETQRHRAISVASFCIFSMVLLSAITVFSVRYGQSEIHCWNSRTPLAKGFWHSRVKAWSEKCPEDRMSMAARIDGSGKTISAVWEYKPLISDGVLLFLVFASLSVGAATIWQLVAKPASTDLLY